MANRIHREFLERGALEWNAFRMENPDVRPNLVGVHLIDQDLQAANLDSALLTDANFTGCNLANVSFSGAIIKDTSFRKSNLEESTFNYCNIQRAEFSDAILSKTRFSNTSVTSSSFWSAILKNCFLDTSVFNDCEFSHADFTGSRFEVPSFAASMLRGCIGLDCVEGNAISIDRRSLELSPGLPDAFLALSGFSNVIYDYLPSLGSFPLTYFSCFISYSSSDREFANKLYGDLRRNDVRCWYDQIDLRIGDRIRDEIDNAIHIQDKLIVIFSSSSMSSSWVEDEVNTALEREQQLGRTILFPLYIESSVLESSPPWVSALRRKRHFGNFSQWSATDSYSTALYRLLRDLKPPPN